MNAKRLALIKRELAGLQAVRRRFEAWRDRSELESIRDEELEAYYEAMRESLQPPERQRFEAACDALGSAWSAIETIESGINSALDHLGEIVDWGRLARDVLFRDAPMRGNQTKGVLK
jgi:hypothetical protein